MQVFTPRAGRRPLARTVIVLGAAALLSACADDTTAPAPTPSRAVMNTEARAAEFTTSVEISVVNALVGPNGATVRVAVTCSGPATFDVMVGVEQELRDGSTKGVVQGTSTFDAVTCSDGSSSFSVDVDPNYGTLQFEPGRATVKAWVVNQQPGVEPATVTRRVRMYADIV